MRHSLEPLLLPVRPRFIGLTLLLAFFINMLPTDNAVWMPDLLAITLLFWTLHQPTRIGMGLAFVLGLMMDVHQSALLGQNASAYVLMVFFIQLMHRRLLSFPVYAQALQLLLIFVVADLWMLVLRLVTHTGALPSWDWLLNPVIAALLWMPVSWLCLMPQSQAIDPDENRPL